MSGSLLSGLFLTFGTFMSGTLLSRTVLTGHDPHSSLNSFHSLTLHVVVLFVAFLLLFLLLFRRALEEAGEVEQRGETESGG